MAFFFKKLFVVKVLLIFPLFFSQEQKISGRIIGLNNKPLQFVEVSLLYPDSNVIVSDLTNEQGNFSIKVMKGKYHLVVKELGKELIRELVDIDKNLSLGDVYIEKSTTIEEVILTSKKPIIKRESDKIIFNIENSFLKDGYNGLEVLKRSPSLRINTDGDILLRNEIAMILVNGRKLNLSSEELNSYLNGLNSENIKSVEIQMVGSAETDAANSGGIVNIVLKKIPMGYQSTIKTQYTYIDDKHSAYLGNINNQFGSEKWNIYNKLNYTDNSNISNFNSSTVFYNFDGKNDNSGVIDFQNKNFNTNTGITFYPNNKNEIAAEFYFAKSNSERNGNENLYAFKPDLYAVSNNQSQYDNNNSLFDIILNYTYKIDSLGSRLKIISDFGGNKFNIKNIVDTKYSLGNLSDNLTLFDTKSSSKFYNVQVDWLQKFKSDWELTVGSKFSKTSRKSKLEISDFNNENWNAINGNQNFSNNEQIIAGYLSVSKKWNKKHNFKIGFRTEYTELKGIDYIVNTSVKQNYFDWFPNIFYSYDINPNNSISLSYSRRIQRPSFRDLNPFIIKQNDFLFQMGNPKLNPQYTDKINLSYRFKNHSFSIYGNLTNNLIASIYRNENNITYTIPENFGKSKNYGFDYSYSGNVLDWLFVNFSTGFWNYDFEITNVKRDKLSFYNTINLQAKLSKTLLLDIVSDYTSKNQFQVVEFSPQYQMDITLQKSIFEKNGTIRITLEDIFNTQRNKNISIYEDFDFRFYQKKKTQIISLGFTYNIKSKTKINSQNIQKANDNINRL